MFTSFTIDVRTDKHLWPGHSLLQVVEVQGAVKCDEANHCPGITRHALQVVQKSLAGDGKIARLHCAEGHINGKKVDSWLWRPQL